MTLPKPPSLVLTALELPRAGLEAGTTLANYRFLLDAPKGDGHPVLVLPGYGAGDGAMAPLRHYLRSLGYHALPWRLGRNWEGRQNRFRSLDDAHRFRQNKEQELLERIRSIHGEYGKKLSLIGWSMGGLYADTLAQHHPDLIRCAITLGSPHGDPRGTSTWSFFRWLNDSHDDNSQADFARWSHGIQSRRKVPTYMIYSESDGIVSPSSAKCHNDPKVKYLKLPSSHIGFAYNSQVYWHIAEVLRRHSE